MKPGRLLHLWIPPALFMGLLYLASSTDDLPTIPRISDKLIHLLAYAVLGLLFLRAFHGGVPAALRWWPTLGAAAATALYGGLDEIHQGFVSGRVRDVRDFAADAAGALLAVLLLALWVRFVRGRP